MLLVPRCQNESALKVVGASVVKIVGSAVAVVRASVVVVRLSGDIVGLTVVVVGETVGSSVGDKVGLGRRV